MTLYQQLGLDSTATPREIKQAYRRLARATHPDAGGDPEAFRRLNHTYKILSNPGSRHIYDQTGTPFTTDQWREQVHGNLAEIIITALDKDPADPAATIHSMIERANDHHQAERADLERRIARETKRAARVRRTSAGDNPVAAAYADRLRKLEDKLTSTRIRILLNADIVKELDHYDFEATDEPSATLGGLTIRQLVGQRL